MSNTYTHIYEVSKLFYAIAISDSRLHDVEKELVKSAITDYRSFSEPSDQFNTDHNVKSEEIIQRIHQENLGAWELFDGFEKYYTDNKTEFSDAINQWIITKANEIASSYARQNKSEIVMIARIRLLLNNH